MSDECGECSAERVCVCRVADRMDRQNGEAITRRGVFASKLLSALVVANADRMANEFNAWPELAADAVMGADALIAELDKA